MFKVSKLSKFDKFQKCSKLSKFYDCKKFKNFKKDEGAVEGVFRIHSFFEFFDPTVVFRPKYPIFDFLT